MGPSCRRRTRNTARKASTRRSLFKKEHYYKSSKNQEIPPAVSVIISPVKPDLLKASGSNDMESAEICFNSVYSTPKAERFRIPEINTCPPAPKKRRVATSSCSLQRSPIAFYTAPDLELFFSLALRGVSV